MGRDNILIKGGRVIDPANEIDEELDVFIEQGAINKIGRNLAVETENVYNAKGYIVTPGLIDIHGHFYEHATPLGVNPDDTSLKRGVTSVVDAGSSGSTTFTGLRKFIAEPSSCRVFAFLHIASHGLASAGCCGFGGGGECDSLNQVSTVQCVETVAANRDIIVGVKVRIVESVTNEGKHEEEVFRRALDASQQSNVPLMVHHSFSSIPTVTSDYNRLSCPGSLRHGDILTHVYHGFPNTIINPKTLKIYDTVWEARKRGVLFDIGHGQGSFSWTVGELCAKEGFWPDTLGTDIHSGNYDSPVYDMTMVMSKILHLGMPLTDVIRAATFTPAKAIGKQDLIGSLGIGREADITVLKEEPFNLDIEDCQGQLRTISKRLKPMAVWCKGKRFEITDPQPLPNVNKRRFLATNWPALVIKDKTQPPK